MFLLKFLIISLFANLDQERCITAAFNMGVKIDTSIFKFLAKDLTVSKSDCTINIEYGKFVFKKNWPIDICKGPIHIRYTTLKDNKILNRTVDCSNPNDYCSAVSELLKILQDGLIRVAGNKYDLDSDHNKLYCAYVLLHNYLKEGVIFDSYGSFDLLNEEVVKEEFKS